MESNGIDIEARRRRVAKIKKTIIILVLILIIIPIVLCVILFCRMSSLENKLEQYVLARNIQIAEGQKFANAYEHEEVTKADTTDNNDTADGALNNENIDTQELKSVETTEGYKVTYLTFDDGPSDNTEEILQILNNYNVKATFFVVMKTDETSIERYKKIVEQGHTLAMHSSSHIYSKIYGSMDNYIEDVTGLQNFLKQITGIHADVYRFPGGSSNTVSNISIKGCAEYLEQNGISYFDWNVASGDAAAGGLSTDEIVNNVISGIEANDSSVVLMHDANDKHTTVEALPIILQKLPEMGVKALPITNETTPVHHKISK